ncbi:MAG: hypothetical protein FJY10_06430 [Bacteroidetes bacterium]|nr:hypothetical protein [Bacteroidota bacterium]
MEEESEFYISPIQPRTNTNPFETRGCTDTPKMYQKNTSIYNKQCCKFETYDWMKDIPLPDGQKKFDIIEVRFKNNRKDFFRVACEFNFEEGDMVAVEANPGHDIGIVSLTGEIVKLQMRCKGVNPEKTELRKVYRRARLADIEKWVAAVEMETPAMVKTRKIVDRLGLSMKINDVEFQGDGTKAIFYYTADDRVDFRELIKLLAEEFKLRIEMRQIGARQEASRLGGIGSCGRELCCSTWMNDFHSVMTSAARTQQLMMNTQKLAGQCSKLKCCLNYELSAYHDAMKSLPNPEIVLKTKKGEAFHQKTDIFRQLMWYSYVSDPSNMLAIPASMVQQIIADNAAGKYTDNLDDLAFKTELKNDFEDVVGQDDLTRFDK